MTIKGTLVGLLETPGQHQGNPMTLSTENLTAIRAAHVERAEMIPHSWDPDVDVEDREHCSCDVGEVTRHEWQILDAFDEAYGDKAYRRHDQMIAVIRNSNLCLDDVPRLLDHIRVQDTEVKQLRMRLRMAEQHASQRDADVAHMDATAARLTMELANLRSHDRNTYVDLLKDRNQLAVEVERLHAQLTNAQPSIQDIEAATI